MSVMIVLLPAIFLGALGALGAWWICRCNRHSAWRYRRLLTSARESPPPELEAVTPEDADHGGPALGERKVADEPIPDAVADLQPAATTLLDPAAAKEEERPWPSSPSSLPAGAATIWNRSNDLLTHELDQTALRRQVQQRIAEWRRGGPGFSVMLVQVDGCRQLLKTHGSNAVELALRATRLFLSVGLREMDLCDRYRQDCFAVLLPATGLENAALLAQRVHRNATECLLPTKHGPLEITRSLGIAEVFRNDDEASLLGRAEAALQSAARNRICCHDGHSLRFVPAAAPAEALATAAGVPAATP